VLGTLEDFELLASSWVFASNGELASKVDEKGDRYKII
jgi:hypothetical protein